MGRSILMTSAPMSASSIVPEGPATEVVRSTTRTPASRSKPSPGCLSGNASKGSSASFAVCVLVSNLVLPIYQKDCLAAYATSLNELKGMRQLFEGEGLRHERLQRSAVPEVEYSCLDLRHPLRQPIAIVTPLQAGNANILNQ